MNEDYEAQRRDAWGRLTAALAELGPTAPKLATNPGFKNAKFIPLPALMELVRPVLESHGLILSQQMFNPGFPGATGIGTQIIDSISGATLLTSELVLPSDPNNPQKAMHAVTYGRRAGITSILGIAEADDDGNSAVPDGPRREGPDNGGVTPSTGADLFA